MAITNEFDDAVKDASADLTTQIQAAETVFKIGEDAEFYSDALAGGRVGPRDRQTVGVVDKTLALLGSDVNIESFIDTPRQVNIGLEGGATIISGSFTFQEFWDEIFKTRNFFQDETPIRVETAIEELTNWYATIEEAKSPDYADRVVESRSIIAELDPIRDDLRSNDDERRARGLQTYAPDALADLVAAPEGLRVIDPTPEDASLRQTLQRVDAARPPAPAPPPPEILSGYDPELARGTGRLEGQQRPAETETVTPQAALDPALRGRSTVAPQTDLGLPDPDPDPSPSRLSAAQIRDANQAEVERLLAERFGGFSFFLQKHRSDLQVGFTADGQVVAADDPNAATVKNILDVIVDQGITAPTRVLGLLENTEWYQTTDARMREYDVLTADMSEPQKLEYLEPVLDNLRDEAQFLGFQLDPTRARELAEKITREGEETDAEVIRGMLVAESAFNAAEVTASSFAAARDEIVAMSKRYFTPINEADAAGYAQDIYVGTKTAEGVEQMFKEQAAINYPQLQNALNANVTPEQYFAPYKYEIERMLDRPNVDLYEEFSDVVQFIPDTGTGEARPMTLGEVRKYVRGLDEWQQSSQAKDSARALAFSIGKTFGEVA